MTSRSKEPRSAEGQRSLNVSHGLTLTALIFSAIEVIAAHCDSCAASCSTTIRTARDRTSGENLVGLGMAPSSQGLEPPGNPARFTSDDDLGLDPRFAQGTLAVDSPSFTLATRSRRAELR